ncbi:23S rRNA pseudouridine(955/2504/2580) synthase RluC [Algicola sagamiensis]|uniref:23S rRNA pseudouridine(955/2504/2580) synthase RluC n=1 Tax=Algicola sagamiensis TaxID=163869 RepID=UPI00037FAA97|nr:23S rRNA pseudouridine(955/2504/2580) synthase RluC [Algicola sagamiensis]
MTEQKASGVQYLTVEEGYEGQRIDNFLKARLKGVPKSVIYRILRKGEVRVNKKRVKPEYKLASGDLLRIPPVRYTEKEPEVNTKLNAVIKLEDAILYEDKYLIVMNKPSGMAVHGGSGLKFGVIEAMRQLRPQERHLELVHRLDRDTSGCLMISKRRSVLKSLHEQLRNKTVQKYYWALVDGEWPKHRHKVIEPLKKNQLQSGERVVRVDKKEGKPSETRFKVLEVYDGCTLVQAFPVTGRTHQIRVHTACKGHSIAMDDKYGNEAFDDRMSKLGLKRLFLHAKSLKFMHPVDETTLLVDAPLDEQLENTLKRLK